MRKILFLFLFILGCTSINVPKTFIYKEMTTGHFLLASWQKIHNSKGIYRIYIEGDGHSFDSYGQPTTDPTPRGTLVRTLAYQDPNDNVIYLSRPCQYVHDSKCQGNKYWTTARFSTEVIDSEYQAIKQIVGDSPVVLIGFSGGGQVVGLLASLKKDLNIQKVITIAGNLDHTEWTKHHKLPPLTDSLSLKDYQDTFQTIPQTHFVGMNDRVIPPVLVKKFVEDSGKIIEIPGASHGSGWRKVYHKIWNE